VSSSCVAFGGFSAFSNFLRVAFFKVFGLAKVSGTFTSTPIEGLASNSFSVFLFLSGDLYKFNHVCLALTADSSAFTFRSDRVNFLQ